MFLRKLLLHLSKLVILDLDFGQLQDEAAGETPDVFINGVFGLMKVRLYYFLGLDTCFQLFHSSGNLEHGRSPVLVQYRKVALLWIVGKSGLTPDSIVPLSWLLLQLS